MKKLFIALVMATIAISLFPFANADVGDSGIFGSTLTAGGALLAASGGNYYASPFVLNVDANITSLHVYGDWYGGSSSGGTKFIVYSLDGTTCYYGSAERITGSGNHWRNETVNFQLMAGTYWLGVRVQDDTSSWIYKVTGNGGTGVAPFASAYGSISPTYTTNLFSIYANYTQAVVDTTEVTAQMISTDWLTFSALMALSLISLILAWKSNVPIINFVFGVVTMGTAAYYLGANIVFAGWINILAILMASLCMLSGAMKLRDA